MLTQVAGSALVEALEIVFPAGQTRPSNPHPPGRRRAPPPHRGPARARARRARRVELDAGDVLRFPGDVPHDYAALDGEPARAIALMAY